MNIVPMSHFKCLILLSCVSLLMACGQKGPLIIKDTSLDIDRAYANTVKSVPVATQDATVASIKIAKEKEFELPEEGYKP